MDFIRFLKHLIDLRIEQRMDIDSLERLRRKRLDRLLCSASKTDHYGLLLREMAFEDLPLTKKESIRSSPASFLADPSGPCEVLRTSGSTGEPLSVHLDGGGIAYRIALRRAVESECGLSPFDKFLEITVREMEGANPLSRLGLFRRQSLSIDESEERNFSLLRKSGADVIGLYPSAVILMAKMNDLSGRPLRLKSAFCAAESLPMDWRAAIEDSFSCPIFDQYGLTETGYVAYECPEEHRMHVLGGSHIVEIVDGKGKPKKSGKGDIVITPLCSHAMPLLRYRTGDRARWGRGCSCGRTTPTLESLEGKHVELVTLPSGRKISPERFYGMHKVPGFLSYQIIQEESGRFLMRFVPSREFGPESERAVTDRIRKACLGEDIRMEFEQVDRIGRGRTGKARAFISRVA